VRCCSPIAWTNIGSTACSALFLADLVDTAIKGAGRFSSFGVGYPIR